MGLDAHGILDLRVTGNFLEPMMPRPCLCCLDETSAQGATTALRFHVPPFNVSDRGCHTPFRIVPKTDLDKPAESSPSALHHDGDATLWGSKVGSNVLGMLLCCASPQIESHPEPLRMVCRLDRTDRHD
jgi:hypothetical protein